MNFALTHFHSTRALRNTHELVLACALCLITLSNYAQPGFDPDDFRSLSFHAVLDSLEKDPHNPKFMWQLSQMVFSVEIHPFTSPEKSITAYIDRYQPFGSSKQDSVFAYFRQMCDMCPNRREWIRNPAFEMNAFLIKHIDELFEDLDWLIQHEPAVEHTSFFYTFVSEGNLPAYLIQRGKLHFMTGNVDKALADFTTALNAQRGKLQFTEACVAAAACHYHRKEFEEALRFIDLAEPAVESNNLSKTAIPKHYNFEEVRIHLWIQMDDYKQLESYLLNRWAGYLKHYYEAVATSGGTMNNGADNLLRKAREYENRYYEQVQQRNPSLTSQEWISILQKVVDTMEE